MKYLSVCDGIGAAHQAWKPLGWRCVGASEIEKFPIAVVEHHHPEIKHLGDMTKHHEWSIESPDLICGGTPCQSFSVAGLRAGLADPRGNLALVFLAIVDRYRPKWVVWENVPGVYSATSHEAPDPAPPSVPLDVVAEGNEVVESDDYDADEDHAFACFLAGLSELGYGACYRTLDAQYAGVPQRRRRCFVVGYLGDWRPSAAVLFEPESLRGDPPPRRGKGERPAGTIEARTRGGGGLGTDFELSGGLVEATDVAAALRAQPNASHRLDCDTYIAHSLRGEGFDASEDGTGRGTPLVPEVTGTLAPNTGPNGNDAGNFASNQGVDAGMLIPEVANPLTARMHKGVNTTMDEGQTMIPVAFKFRGGGNSTGERGGNTGGGGGVGYLGQEECAFTVATSEDQMVAVPECADPVTSKWAKGAEALQAGQRSGWNCIPAGAYDITGIPAKEGAKEADVHVKERARRPGESEGSTTTVLATRLAVRRLTPRECERLQSFQVRCSPDALGAWQDEAGRWWTEDYTAIPWRGKPASECPDGPRYKALGNSWCVNEVHWIGRRIQLVDDILKSQP